MFALFDIGGTKTRISVSKDGKECAEPFVFHTEQKISAQIANMLDAIDQMGSRHDLRAAAGGIAGPLDPPKTKLLGAPNLPASWIGAQIKQEFENAFGVPVYLENDTAMVGLGEAVSGAGKGNDIVAYITVSTGVGGARLVRGKIDEKHIGFEPGHHIINYTDQNGGMAQSYISGRALEERSGKKPKEIKSEEVWEAEAKLLAVVLYNVTVFWSPNTIVLGGSMITGSPCIPLEHVEEHLKKLMKIFPEVPTLKKAELGDFGGLYGSLEYLKQNGYTQ